MYHLKLTRHRKNSYKIALPAFWTPHLYLPFYCSVRTSIFVDILRANKQYYRRHFSSHWDNPKLLLAVSKSISPVEISSLMSVSLFNQTTNTLLHLPLSNKSICSQLKHSSRPPNIAPIVTRKGIRICVYIIISTAHNIDRICSWRNKLFSFGECCFVVEI